MQGSGLEADCYSAKLRAVWPATSLNVFSSWVVPLPFPSSFGLTDAPASMTHGVCNTIGLRKWIWLSGCSRFRHSRSADALANAAYGQRLCWQGCLHRPSSANEAATIFLESAGADQKYRVTDIEEREVTEGLASHACAHGECRSHDTFVVVVVVVVVDYTPCPHLGNM